MLDFDYKAVGFSSKAAKRLEVCAGHIHDHHEAGRIAIITHALEQAKWFHEAWKEFSQLKEEGRDGTWKQWCNERLEEPVSKADKGRRIHKVFGGKNPEDVAGLPVEALNKLSQVGVDPSKRRSVLAKAKKNWLTMGDVNEIMNPDGSEKEERVRHPLPADRKQLLEAVRKPVDKLAKRLHGAPCKDELSSVLNELAEEYAVA